MLEKCYGHFWSKFRIWNELYFATWNLVIISRASKNSQEPKTNFSTDFSLFTALIRDKRTTLNCEGIKFSWLRFGCTMAANLMTFSNSKKATSRSSLKHLGSALKRFTGALHWQKCVIAIAGSFIEARGSSNFVPFSLSHLTRPRVRVRVSTFSPAAAHTHAAAIFPAQIAITEVHIRLWAHLGLSFQLISAFVPQSGPLCR